MQWSLCSSLSHFICEIAVSNVICHHFHESIGDWSSSWFHHVLRIRWIAHMSISSRLGGCKNTSRGLDQDISSMIARRIHVRSISKLCMTITVHLSRQNSHGLVHAITALTPSPETDPWSLVLLCAAHHYFAGCTLPRLWILNLLWRSALLFNSFPGRT